MKDGLPLVLSLAPQALAQEHVFRPFRPGITAAQLYQDPGGGSSAAILRYSPGANVPLHRHAGYEHVLILEGAQQDERGVYEAGTLVVNPPGSVHSVSSPLGCTVLVVWERPIVFLSEPPGKFVGKEPTDTRASPTRHEDETPIPR